MAPFKRAEIIHWIAENKRPYSIVKNRGFLSLIKTGQPEYYLPSPSTVSRDVKKVFAHVRGQIAQMLQVYLGISAILQYHVN